MRRQAPKHLCHSVYSLCAYTVAAFLPAILSSCAESVRENTQLKRLSSLDRRFCCMGPALLFLVSIFPCFKYGVRPLSSSRRIPPPTPRAMQNNCNCVFVFPAGCRQICEGAWNLRERLSVRRCSIRRQGNKKHWNVYVRFLSRHDLNHPSPTTTAVSTILGGQM